MKLAIDQHRGEFGSEANIAKYYDAAKRRVQRKRDQLAARDDVRFTRDALSFSVNQLEHLERQVYDILFSNPVDAFVLLPVNSSPPDGATEYAYRMAKSVGTANTVGDGTQDRHMVEKDLEKFTRVIYEGGSGYTYTVGDSARSGGLLDYNYVLEKARYSAEAIARWHNNFALLGGAGVPGGPTAVTGFLNDAGVTAVAKNWATLPAGLDAYNDVTDFVQAVNSGSDGVHSATDVVLSTKVWNHVQKTLLDNTTGGLGMTVLAALRQNYPEITWRKSESCTDVGGANIDHCVAYERSNENAEYVASVVLDEATPDKQGFKYTVQTRGRAAGTVIRRPKAQVYGQITTA